MPPIVPTATYRVQLTAKFGFAMAADIVPYLHRLGISHLYASPFLTARAGSTHGYDIVDHSRLNPEFGGEEGFAQLSDALAAADMGLILDFVPNHMGVGHSDNCWWLDVLEWGPRSPYAVSFDIDWTTLPFRREGGLLLPILGRTYGETLEQGEIELKYDSTEGSFSAWYFDHRLPIRPNRYGDIMKTVVAAAGAAEEPAGRRLLDLAERYPDPNDPAREEAPAYKSAIASVDGGAAIIARGLRAYRPDPQQPTRQDAARVMLLHRLLERQHYRVAHWRVAVSEINYRRFFDVNDLAGIRIEDPRTFHDAHELVARLLREGRLHGLRLDHVDGLHDPGQYARRLQRLIRWGAEADPRRRRFYVVAEKILADGEPMPSLAGVAGTTGYDVLNDISRVLLDGSGLPGLDRLWNQVSRGDGDFAAILRQAKARVLDALLSSEFTVLTRLLGRIAAGHWRSRDFTLDRLRGALRLYIVHFPVYRSYISGGVVPEEDRATIGRTIALARGDWFGADSTVFDFLHDVLTLDIVRPGRGGYSTARVRRFAAKVQQLTGPVMAKALEDTSFYRFHRLLALNEVGGNPALGALSIADFHDRMAARARQFPHAMTATATHDTKRGEDARMRILALAELAGDWAVVIDSWRTLNASCVRHGRRRAPSIAHEYMLYQALIGAWPGADGPDRSFVERMQAYAIKAAREGKQETNWLNPAADYEKGLSDFVEQILDPGRSSRFIDQFAQFAQRTSLIGALNSLSQLTLKATIPGVPDFYQGSELWDLSLVDPDNRRPVDFAARRGELGEDSAAADWDTLATSWADGRIKLALTQALLALRKRFADLFANGQYVPLEPVGRSAGQVIAFARVLKRDAIIVAVGRGLAPATDSGRRWPRAEDWDAVIKMDGFEVKADLLAPNQRPDSAHLVVGTLFSPVPVCVLRASRRR
jgi:(1->4)-alpha-D-glucan 1-alpha-D-glucosylmutase